MKNKIKNNLAAIITLAVLLLMIIPVIIWNVTQYRITENAVIHCAECGAACKISYQTECTSPHKEAKDYYEYTYKCVECGTEFKVEKVEEKR